MSHGLRALQDIYSYHFNSPPFEQLTQAKKRLSKRLSYLNCHRAFQLPNHELVVTTVTTDINDIWQGMTSKLKKQFR